MTGFARTDGQWGAFRWTWEARSVNGRGLDVRVRLSPGSEGLEPKTRAAVTERLSRGNVSVNLQMTRAEEEPKIRINRALLEEVLRVAAELAGRGVAEPPRLDGLLSIRGVIEVFEPEETEEQRQARETAIAESFGEALGALIATRAEEGVRIARVLAEQLREIEGLVAAASACAAAQPVALKARLREQVQALLDSLPGLSEERLAQEAALLAVKADVREELDRLTAHVEAARDLLENGSGSGQGVGRQLDFLCQEFNREANTLCSKSSSIELTRIGLGMKTAVDRLREQIQNIE